ncbi:MAG TPA: BON domain-containing protein [Ktedonobacterales bacterium]
MDRQVSEYARVLLQPGKLFRAEHVLGMPAPYRDRLSGVRAEITRLWLWPQSAQVTAAVRFRKNLLSKKEDITPLSADAPLEPAKREGCVELRAKMQVFCTDEHHEKARYRVGNLEGLTVAARTGLADGLVVRVRAHPEAEVERPTDPLAPLVAVAGRRLVLSPAWAMAAGDGELVLSAFPAQVASSVEYLNDWQVRERIWAILNENPALQPYLSWLGIEVKDGVAYLSGRLPMARLRNSAKQDIWHVPGVVGIEDTLRVEGD